MLKPPRSAPGGRHRSVRGKEGGWKAPRVRGAGESAIQRFRQPM